MLVNWAQASDELRKKFVFTYNGKQYLRYEMGSQKIVLVDGDANVVHKILLHNDDYENSGKALNTRISQLSGVGVLPNGMGPYKKKSFWLHTVPLTELPPGWIVQQSRSTGKLFFANTSVDPPTTQYADPRATRMEAWVATAPLCTVADDMFNDCRKTGNTDLLKTLLCNLIEKYVPLISDKGFRYCDMKSANLGVLGDNQCYVIDVDRNMYCITHLAEGENPPEKAICTYHALMLRDKYEPDTYVSTEFHLYQTLFALACTVIRGATPKHENVPPILDVGDPNRPRLTHVCKTLRGSVTELCKGNGEGDPYKAAIDTLIAALKTESEKIHDAGMPRDRMQPFVDAGNI